ncbi:2-amino-4-hydroxy-6-hydroxymethyldihydropteridine diphosphokinase [Parvularcula sp. LCG005]|uniref:2-amino-4-hydroxy-6- hydroxymethyldihydropteridine diphosphokinase n=1 Tax=Parvularcula sp. LCG005 TaxID=3078805 RepID=UPI002942C561|nr:2-amino-4-hydroxy-6-hydroxymethyldihydropteridine diphosphokinase [Parvularcula sp. LCG005]WOI54251.1 2-amino-4-hydroxy-6-hydroxymethyldihydropteridine diphosphokinase [Parvularcula sp. LCG005]
MPQIHVGVGSNKTFWQAPSAELVHGAYAALQCLGTDAVMSPLYRSAAWPDATQPPYVNAVVRLSTSLPPQAVLVALQAIEAAFGRVRFDDPARRYAPRTMDLDLLDYEGVVQADTALTLPHPAIAQRDFVLLPLRDVTPKWQHPVTGQGIGAMIEALPLGTAKRLGGG